MTPETRKQALRAAAKLALCMTVAGCSATHPQSSTAGLDSSDASVLADGDTDAGCDPESLETCTPESFAAYINDCTDNVVRNGEDTHTVAISTQDANCCTQALRGVPSGVIPGTSTPFDMTVLNTHGQQAFTICCNALHWPLDKGCEAWGPPMPPSMNDEVTA